MGVKERIMKLRMLLLPLALVAVLTAACDKDGKNGHDADVQDDHVETADPDAEADGEPPVDEEVEDGVEGIDEGVEDVPVDPPADDAEADAAEDPPDIDALDGTDEVELNAAGPLCEALAEAYCDYLTACCTAEELLGLPEPVDCSDPASSAYFDACYASYAPYVDNATVQIYDAALPGCLAIFSDMASSCPAFNAAPSGKPWYMDSGCSEIVRGLIDPGGHCESSEQCSGSYYCDTSVSPSVCAARVALSGACTANAQCTAGNVCAGGTCRAAVASGGACDEDADCNLGLYCDASAGNRCAAMLGAGSPCDETADACEGLCIAGTPSTCASFCDGL
jgi:hypothetical protein